MYVLDHADLTAPNRERELDHTDHTHQAPIFPEISVDHQVGLDGLHEGRKLCTVLALRRDG